MLEFNLTTRKHLIHLLFNNNMARRGNKISKKTSYTKLFVKDMNYIIKMVDENSKNDKIYVDKSSAIRHYVKVGIAAEHKSDGMLDLFDSNIVRRSQRNAVREELKPLANTIKNLTDEIKDLREHNESIFGDISNQITAFQTAVSKSFEDIIETHNNDRTFDIESLRNIFVMRSIIYVFLLGIQTGKVLPGKDNLKRWNAIIGLAHKKANKLSIQELKNFNSEEKEKSIVQRIANELFEETQKIKPVKFS